MGLLFQAEEATVSFREVWMEIKHRIEELLGSDRDRILIGIDGRAGSGKTTLARKLAEVFDCNVFHMDDFFLQGYQRTEERAKEVGGNVDYERFQKEVLLPLRKKETVWYRPFRCQTMELQEKVEMPFRRLNIIEGSYAQHPYFGDPYDLKIFVDIDPDLQLERIEKRNGAEKLEQFKTLWIPKEEAYFAKFRIAAHADRIISGKDF